MAGEKSGLPHPPSSTYTSTIAHPSSPPPYSASASASVSAPPSASASTSYPPPSSSPNPSGALTSPLPQAPGLPPVQLSLYKTPSATTSEDQTTVSAYASHLCTTPAALVVFIKAQAALPPLPELRITGGRRYTGGGGSGSGSGGALDFDLRFNLLRYLVPAQQQHQQQTEKGFPQALNYTVIRNNGPPGVKVRGGAGSDLESWARAFCSDTSSMKSFTLTRSVTNWDTSLLSARIHALLATLKYRGTVTVSFPVSFAKVVVAPPRALSNGFVASLFVAPRAYDVVEAVWPFATLPPSDGLEQCGGSGESTCKERRFAVRSEEGWWREWETVMEYAILEGKKGWIGLDDLMEVKMGARAPKRRASEWGVAGC